MVTLGTVSLAIGDKHIKSSDKFLIGIVAGVVFLVSMALALAFLQSAPTYQPDDTPEGVAHNYLLALRQKDYARAYSYLSPTLKQYPPSTEAFAGNVEGYTYNFDQADSSTTLQVVSIGNYGERATIIVRETQFYRNGLFGSREYANTFDMRLKQENGAWKLIGSDKYWASCWDYDNNYGC